jgi:hypothetical protein
MLAVVAAGCSNPLAPRAVAGTWAEDISIPGSFRHLVIGANGSALMGTGNFCGEAGPCGTFTISGSVVDNEVRLDFAYPDGVSGHFVGHMEFDKLSGLETTGAKFSLPPAGTTAYPVTYRRANWPELL